MKRKSISNERAKARGKKIGTALKTTGSTTVEGVQFLGRGIVFLGKYAVTSIRDFGRGIKEGLTNG